MGYPGRARPATAILAAAGALAAAMLSAAPARAAAITVSVEQLGDAVLIDYYGKVRQRQLDGKLVERDRRNVKASAGRLLNVEGELVRFRWDLSQDDFGDGPRVSGFAAEGDSFGFTRRSLFMDADAGREPIAGTLVFESTSIDVLGFAAGIHVWKLANGQKMKMSVLEAEGSSAVDGGDGAASVPVPAAAPMLAVALGALGLLQLRRRRA